jgi:peptide deformylase
MAILPLIIAPDPRLKKISEPVEKVDNKLKDFMRDMLETMYENKGLGLAAVQVGVHKRVIVMDIAQGSIRYDGTHNPDAQPEPLYLVNPEIIEESEDLFIFEEGCLSFPAQFADVERPRKVKVKYLDFEGKTQTKTFENLASVCVQHEIDHLNGITFVDYLSNMKRDYIIKKLDKFKKRNNVL